MPVGSANRCMRRCTMSLKSCPLSPNARAVDFFYDDASASDSDVYIMFRQVNKGSCNGLTLGAASEVSVAMASSCCISMVCF